MSNNRASKKPIYAMDTSAWLGLERREDFDALWALIVTLVKESRLFTAPEILKELKHPDHKDRCEIYKRLRLLEHQISFRKKRDQEFHDILGDLHFRFPAMCRSRSRYRRPADPYIVATAKRCGFVLISQETLARRPSHKIPFACNALSVRCLTLGELMDAERPPS